MNPTPVKSLFENTMENPFSYFLEYWTKLFNIFFWSGQTENTQICVFVYRPFVHFLKSKTNSESRFELRMFIFQLFVLMNFGQYFKK